MAWLPKVSTTGRIPLPVAIERYFQVALFLLVLTGFGTLASTGTLDLPTVVLVGGALLVRGYLLGRRINTQIPPVWTTYLTLAYAVFYFADYTLLSGNFLTATVHLVLFGMVVRLFSVQRERDHVMLAVLAFLMVLASAVLTVDSVFLLAFAGFMLMAVGTFILMEMRRASRAATISSRDLVDGQVYRRMAFSLAGMVPALVGLILVGGIGIFFLLPRTSAGYLSAFATGNDLSTGFSDRVELGRIGQIQQSTAVVMHVQIDGDRHGQFDLKWRGVALEHFDGKSWSSPVGRAKVARQGAGRFLLDQESTKPFGKHIHYRVLMEPIGSNVFFLAAWPRSLAGAYRVVGQDATGSVFDLDEMHPISVYDAESDVGTPSAPLLRLAGTTYPPRLIDDLALPAKTDRRIAALAQEITGRASNAFDKADTIQRYLTSHYKYTLQLPKAEPADPLANFLFERKEGHCEYFASSMAVMLRSVGIPSRVVNGFRTTEFNDLTSSYVIRASSAHSWVEVYFPGTGWVEFDPTPPAPLLEREGWNRVSLYADAMASFWREWVVNYDIGHQRLLGQNAMQGSRAAVESMRKWARDRYAAMLMSARKTQGRISRAPGRWGAIGIGIAGLLLLAVNARALRGWIQKRRIVAHPETAPRMAATLWYDRMTHRVAKRGWEKQAGQTPQEFVRAIQESPLRDRVSDFTNAYEAARFGESPDHAQRLPELYEEIVAVETRD